jgi:dolichol-phosphate mannosyltransferase
VIPAHNEEGCVATTVEHLHGELSKHQIPHELVVVDDGSTDRTWDILGELKKRIPQLVPVQNLGEHGYGRAVVKGLDTFTGDAVCVVMADESDDPADVVVYWEMLQQGYACVFGSRFVKGGQVIDYPWFKLRVNRLANWIVRQVFRIKCNDITNAFKGYRREVIEGCRPFLSPHFNLTVEIPLKAVVRGYTWTVVPITWRNRTSGESKLKIKEMGSRYFFIMMYCWLEKWFSRGDYLRTDRPRTVEPNQHSPAPPAETSHGPVD